MWLRCLFKEIQKGLATKDIIHLCYFKTIGEGVKLRLRIEIIQAMGGSRATVLCLLMIMGRMLTNGSRLYLCN